MTKTFWRTFRVTILTMSRSSRVTLLNRIFI